MPYYPLGFRPCTATPDTTELNSGNWTAVLDQTLINVSVPVFECYHLYITTPSTTAAVTATVMIDLGHWDVTLTGQNNAWDPAQPILLIPVNTIYIMFAIPTSATPPPTVTAWFRYSTV